MTIRYTNGQIIEAVLLSRTETTMRVTIPGSDDSLTLNRVNGVWISEDCEPVDVHFSWSSTVADSEVTEEDCICSRELAARLIHLLYAGDDEPAAGSPPVGRTMAATVFHQVV